MSDDKTTEGMPIRLTLDPGVYFRCVCGKSQNLPFCDGTHPPGSQVPIRFELTRRQQIYLCGCNQSAKMPYCDSSCGVKIEP